MKKRAKLLVASILAFAASASQAQPIDTWEYTLELNWVTSATVFNSGTPTPGYLGGTTNTSTLLSWGERNSDYKNVNPSHGDNRSALEISGTPATGTVGIDGKSVAANMFTHYNAPIYDLYPSLDMARLSVTVDLALPGSSTLYTLHRDFDVYFIETPNTGKQCAWGLCDNDIFSIITVAPTLDNFTDSFVIGGYEYTFKYFETSDFLKPLSGAACAEAGIKSGLACYGFTTPEARTTQVTFGFSMTATPVPEPETYAMLLAGLGVMGIVARRRRS